MNPLSIELNQILELTEADVWAGLRGQRVFLTGGTGFFGRWLLESFAWANDQLDLRAEIEVLSRDPAGFLQNAPHLKRPDISWRTGGILELPATQSGKGARYFIHGATAASAAFNSAFPQVMYDTCALGTKRAIDFSLANGTERFLLTSSGAVYGNQPADVLNIPEEYQGGPDPLSHRSAYAEGKRAAEHLCALQHLQVPTWQPIIARCFAFVGPFLPLDAHFAVGNFLRDALAGGPIVVTGDGRTIRSYLHASDLTRWLWTLLVQGGPARAYNVGSPFAVSIADLAKEICLAAGLEPDSTVIRQTTNPNEPIHRYVPSIERARQELGLDVLRPLDSALASSLNVLRAMT